MVTDLILGLDLIGSSRVLERLAALICDVFEPILSPNEEIRMKEQIYAEKSVG